MKIVAFVPAKAESERVTKKNLCILDGEYLFKRKLRQLLECEQIDQVYLDTESDELAELASDLPVSRIKRPVDLASNKTDGHKLFAYETSQVNADVYIQCLCTSPFIDHNTVNRALEQFLDHLSATSLVAVRKEKQYRWENNRPLYGYGRIPNSCELPDTIIEAMGLYVVRKCPDGSAPQMRFQRDAIVFALSGAEAIDVNYPGDLELAETICAGRRAQSNLGLNALKPYLSSALLSDVSKELDFPSVLPPQIRPLTGYKILGRAKTLRLDPLEPNEDWPTIYKSLKSYDFIRPGDVIIVSTGIPERAYFGELNANLALRSGAIGTIVDGFTRDSEALAQLQFPIFARGSYCLDLKYEGTMRSMNQPVQIGQITVSTGDYVLADADGVVIIPQHKWKTTLDCAWENMETEWEVRKATALGCSTEQIVQNFGFF